METNPLKLNGNGINICPVEVEVTKEKINGSSNGKSNGSSVNGVKETDM